LAFLKVNDEPIAFAYCIEQNGTLYGVKLGHNPAYHRYGPSILLQHRLVAWTFEKGITAYDFLGDNDGWKMDWANRTRDRRWYYVYAPTHRGRLAYLAKTKIGPKLASYGRQAKALLSKEDWRQRPLSILRAFTPRINDAHRPPLAH